MNKSNCPTSDNLTAYVSGKLMLDEHELIDAHLEQCHSCQETAEILDANCNTFFTPRPNSQSRHSAEEDAELLKLVEYAKAIGNSVLHGNHGPSGESASDDGLAEGSVFGNYVLHEQIGCGGMGRVFRASHRRMNRDVAIKVLSPTLVTSDEARQRFQREVEAAAKLTHPNIVAAYDADEAGGHVFLAMELVDGKNLDTLIKHGGPFSIRRAVNLITQAARGLEYSHGMGIVHRDIKPANLLLDHKGIVKVLDMGLARSPLRDDDSGSNNLTSSPTIIGTAAYMAPEQALNPREVDQQADIYSLGCTLHYLLTGRTVYNEKTVMEMVIAHREKPIPALVEHCPNCPKKLDRAFGKMIAKRCDDRYESMASVLADLEAIESNFTNADAIRGPSLPPSKDSLKIALISFAAFVVFIVILTVAKLTFNSFNSATDAVTSDDKDGTAGSIGIEISSQATANKLNKRTLAPVSVEMVQIPKGEFWMGASDDDENATPNEKPRHQVRITRPFLLGKFEVTRTQYQQVMGTLPESFADDADTSQASTTKMTNQLPVTGISWRDAVQFCNRLSEQNGLQPYYRIDGKEASAIGGNGFRLPTEAEWEYACRAGTNTRWHFGDDPKMLDQYAWHESNANGAVQSAGTKKPNQFKLFDMHGNAPEWVWDRHDDDYYKNSEAVNPTGSTRGERRVFRGGGVSNFADQTRSSVRSPLGMSYGFFNGVGLRVARDIAVHE